MGSHILVGGLAPGMSPPHACSWSAGHPHTLTPSPRRDFQGGATTVTAGLRFVQPAQFPSLSIWTWAHQGVYLDADGSLLNDRTLPGLAIPPRGLGAGEGPARGRLTGRGCS